MPDPFKGLPVSLGLSSLSPQQKEKTPPAVPLAMRHLPQRMHDQEKLYSPPLKTLAGGYSYDREAHLRKLERIERERLEYCREHERQRNIWIPFR